MLTLSRRNKLEVPKSKNRFTSNGRKSAQLECLESRVMLSTVTLGPITTVPQVSNLVPSHAFDVSQPPGNWYPNGNSTISLPTFDTTGGKVLTGVTLTYSVSEIQEYLRYDQTTGTGAADEIITNFDQNNPISVGNPNANIATTGTGTLTLTPVAGLTLADVPTVTANTSIPFSPNPLIIPAPASSTSPTQGTISGLDLETSSNTVSFTSGTQLAAFSTNGTGTIQFTLTSNGFDLLQRHFSGSFLDSGGLQTAGRGSITVTYTYGTPKAKISITPDAVNEVGQPHTFTTVVQYDDGLAIGETGGDAFNGFTFAQGATTTISLTGSNGAVPTPPGPFSGLSDLNGQFSGTFTSLTAGKVTGHATASLTVLGTPLVVSTDGLNGDSGNAVKRFVDANITIAPNGNNPVGAPHTFIVTVEENDGLNANEGGDGVTGFAPVSGANVTVNLAGTLGAIPDISAPTDLPAGNPSTISGTTNASGQFSVTFTSAVSGTVTGNGYATLTVGGVALTRDTDPATTTVGAGPNGSGPAIKTFFNTGTGHSATIGFWHNKNGLAVILSSPNKNLSTWLATNFPNLYGAGAGAFNLTGATNQQVFDFFQSGVNSYFGTTGTKTNAQVMCLALAVYFNDVANTSTAQKYGFDGGLGANVVSINGNASAFAGFLEPGGTTITINNMLNAANFYANNGVIWGGSGSNWIKVNNQFDFVNNTFDI